MKLIEIIYFLAFLACLAGNCACISSGSSVTDITPYGYQVAVFCPVIMCSGAIVSSNKVVTTAACINTLLPADVEVYAGSAQYYSGGITYNVQNIIKHPSFNPFTYDANIAVLIVATPFDFSLGTIKSIELASALPPPFTYLLTTAYGATNPLLDLPSYLQKTNLQLFSTTFCATYKSNRVLSTMFCAGDSKGNKDLCPGDQGAPAVYIDKLYGIYSWGCSCGLAAPGPSTPVFISIPSYRSWIINAQ